MRYWNIFLLNLQKVFEHRSRSLIWFLMSLLNPIFQLLYWKGTEKFNGQDFTYFTGYYFLLVIASAFLSSHIEESVGIMDIKDGKLVSYLLKPVPYYWIKFIEEIPYRVLQGSFGIIVLTGFIFIAHQYHLFTTNPFTLLLSFIIMIFAYFISFTFKMIIGYIAFWTKDIYGIFQMADVTRLIFAGFIMPIDLLPTLVKQIAYFLPFSYMIYFPIISFQGKLNVTEQYTVIVSQAIWLIGLLALQYVMWRRGIYKFTGMGQ